MSQSAVSLLQAVKRKWRTADPKVNRPVCVTLHAAEHVARVDHKFEVEENGIVSARELERNGQIDDTTTAEWCSDTVAPAEGGSRGKRKVFRSGSPLVQMDHCKEDVISIRVLRRCNRD
ncbi:hypothetical protein RvY_03186 [Ramazzottius varieornatus]|uniref:Uncharacterized protein n=1 Tax=Ramazzottius varieornatus TaxID=947166 RepID=A0A1D1UWM0_RAMVA|nr:hypothetical protein RvY_03186 [Ramazzottius varieornatus]